MGRVSSLMESTEEKRRREELDWLRSRYDEVAGRLKEHRAMVELCEEHLKFLGDWLLDLNSNA